MDNNKLEKEKPKKNISKAIGNLIAHIGALCLLIGIGMAMYKYLGLIAGLCLGGLLLILIGCSMAEDEEKNKNKTYSMYDDDRDF